MKITVVKKKQIEVDLDNDMCESIVVDYLRDYYWDTLERVPYDVSRAIDVIYMHFSGKPTLDIER